VLQVQAANENVFVLTWLEVCTCSLDGAAVQALASPAMPAAEDLTLCMAADMLVWWVAGMRIACKPKAGTIAGSV
jgi:hypothetical protein